MDVWPEPMRVRGASFGALVWLCLGTAGLAQGIGPDCTPELSITESTPNLIAVHIGLPCRPYAPVDVLYGPFRIGEELSQDGVLDMILPRIGTNPDVTVEDGRQRHRLTAPDVTGPVTGYVAVLWTDQPRWGGLQLVSGVEAQHLGFVGRTDQPDMDLLAIGSDAKDEPGLTVPVRPDTCGRRLQATVQSSQGPRPQTLSVTIPPCDLIGQSVWIPLR